MITILNESVAESKYLIINKEEIANRKTPIYHIINKSSNIELAQIKWYGSWRQFCVFFTGETIFNIDCLKFIK